MVILKVSHITKRYKHIVGVEDVSFEIRKGQVVGFVGANGAGKTTTMKAILDFHRIDSGTIELFGLPHTDKNARLNVGFLAERPYFYDGLTGLEFLEFYGRLSGLEGQKARARANELLQLVGLAHVAKRSLREYSKGMTQRMGIAQAMVHDPELLILDEPVSGLDPMGRLEVQHILTSLKTRGKTILFSSHILPDVEAICDDVILIHRGKLALQSEGQRILKSSIKYFEFNISGIDVAKAKQLFPAARFVGPATNTTVVHFNHEDVAEGAQLLSVHQKIVQAGGAVVQIMPMRERLEDLMFQLARHDKNVGGREEREH